MDKNYKICASVLVVLLQKNDGPKIPCCCRNKDRNKIIKPCSRLSTARG